MNLDHAYFILPLEEAKLTKTDRRKPAPIAMTPIVDLYLAIEAPKGADFVVRDSSSGSPLTDAELKASIGNHGIIQPLIFRTFPVKTPDGLTDRKFVIAGNRRLRFLREIFAGSTTIEVQTQNVDDFEGDWREIAMDTNLSLPPHLVERYEIIVALVKDLKLSPEDARLRYGMTPRQFGQVMRLGKMSEKIRTAWKAGEIDAKTAQAFTLEPDTKEQDKIFEAAKKRGHDSRVDTWFVKERIIPSGQRDIGKLVEFVGMDVCKKAKIIKQEDLFSHDHIVTDIKALNKLAGDKLAEKCKEITDAGWSWALPKNKIDGNAWDYGSITPEGKALATAAEKARMAELDQLMISDPSDDEEFDDEPLIDEREKIEESIKARGFTPEQRAKAGCFIEVGSDGGLKIEYGKIKPSQKKSVAATERAKSISAKKNKAKDSGEPVMTIALAERLSEQLQRAGAELLKNHHDVAVSALIAGFACQKGEPIDVSIGDVRGKPSSFLDVFGAALKSTPEQRAAMLAQIAAQAFSIITHNPEKLPLDKEEIWELFESMKGPAVIKAIGAEFNAKDYFASVSGSSIVETVRCVLGDDLAAKVEKMDKGAKAKFAVANLKDTAWLPKALRTSWYTGPVEGSAKAPKLAKKAKKTAKKQ